MKPVIHPIIENRIPDFIRQEYPNFVEFIIAYFKWLEQDDNFLGIINQWKLNNEPSLNVDPYVDAILRDIGWWFERPIALEKSKLIHFLREFYMARGSEQSFRLLFNILFGVTPEIRYPRDRLLIPSQAEYGQQHYLFTSSQSSQEDILAAATLVIQQGGLIRGITSKAAASIQSIGKILGIGGEYLQVEILQPLTEFIPNEPVVIEIGDIILNEVVKPVASFRVMNPGFFYEIGDQVKIFGAGVDGAATVSHLQGQGIQDLIIDNPGCGYSVGMPIYTRKQDDGGGGFSGIVSEVDITGAITKAEVVTPGYGYTKQPEFYVRVDQSSNMGRESDIVFCPPASFTVWNQGIGAVKKIQSHTPFIDFPIPSAAWIESQSGLAAWIEVDSITRWTTERWNDRRGFLGENSHLIDSYKFQQFSYELSSPVNPSAYREIVSELLHPVGYVQIPSIAFEVEHQVDIQSYDDGTLNISVTIETEYLQSFTHEWLLPQEDIGQVIVTDGGNALLTQDGYTIGWGSIEDTYMMTSDGDEIVTNDGDIIRTMY